MVTVTLPQVPKVFALSSIVRSGFKMCYLPITPITLLLLLIPTVRAIAVHGSAMIDGGREERPPPPKSGEGGIWLGGPQEKMSFFQIAPGPILSIPIYLKTCLYGPCKFSLKKNDQNLPAYQLYCRIHPAHWKNFCSRLLRWMRQVLILWETHCQ